MMRAKYISDDLLNTAEAARFLRVSQASIRRWSDSGLLQAQRVGRRRERRFRESDLATFVDGSTPAAPGAAAATVAGVTVNVPLHLATFFSTDLGGLRLAVPFLADGIRLRQPSYLVASGDVLRRYADALEISEGIEVVHFEGGLAADAIAQWEQILAGAMVKGASVIRIVGEMAAEREMFASEDQMLAYEEAFEVMCRRYPVAVMCQYDVRHFDGLAILRALKAHPDLFGLRTGAFLN